MNRSRRAPARPRRSGLLARAVAELGRRVARGEYAPSATLPVESDLAEELDVVWEVVKIDHTCGSMGSAR